MLCEVCWDLRACLLRSRALLSVVRCHGSWLLTRMRDVWTNPFAWLLQAPVKRPVAALLLHVGARRRRRGSGGLVRGQRLSQRGAGGAARGPARRAGLAGHAAGVLQVRQQAGQDTVPYRLFRFHVNGLSIWIRWYAVHAMGLGPGPCMKSCRDVPPRVPLHIALAPLMHTHLPARSPAQASRPHRQHQRVQRRH